MITIHLIQGGHTEHNKEAASIRTNNRHSTEHNQQVYI